MSSLQKTNPSSSSPIEMASQVMKLEKLKRDAEKRLKQLKTDLLEVMKQTDVLTLKTGSYTISRASRETYRVDDEMDTEQRLEEMGHDVIKKIDLNYMKPIIKHNLDKLPGVSRSETEYVSIRLTTKKEK